MDYLDPSLILSAISLVIAFIALFVSLRQDGPEVVYKLKVDTEKALETPAPPQQTVMENDL